MAATSAFHAESVLGTRPAPMASPGRPRPTAGRRFSRAWARAVSRSMLGTSEIPATSALTDPSGWWSRPVVSKPRR